MALQAFDGPIPGENFTSDTKNYAWHRPPEYTDLDEAIEYIGTKLTSEESSAGLITMMEMGVPVVDLTQMFLMSGVGAGKWTLDFALMLAGPTAHIISLMGQSFGVQYDLGLTDSKADRPPSRAVFEMTHEINRAKAAAAGRRAFDSVDDIAADTDTLFKDGVMEQSPPPKFRGFMSAQAPGGPAPAAEQEAMMGQGMPQEGMM